VKHVEELSKYIEALAYRMKVTEQNACNEVNLQEMQVLSFLSLHPGAKMTEIAEYLMVGLSNLTAIVDKLVAKHLTQRDRSEEDRRGVLASLTTEGKAVAAAHRSQKLDLARQMLSALNASDQEKLMAIMRMIVGKLNSEGRS